MKHFAQIQSEFLKLSIKKKATWWQRLSPQEKRNYLVQHPGSQLPFADDVEYDSPDPEVGKLRGKIHELKNNMFKILNPSTGQHDLVPVYSDVAPAY